MQKFKLLRDGQIVGYLRQEPIEGSDSINLYSYDNQDWFGSIIPYSDKKAFIKFDQDNLVEVYEE